jgi:hypothetical protein
MHLKGIVEDPKSVIETSKELNLVLLSLILRDLGTCVNHNEVDD